jgi:hypothetical protein
VNSHTENVAKDKAVPPSSFVSAYVFPCLILAFSWSFSGVVALKVPVWLFSGTGRSMGLVLLPTVSILVFVGARLLISRPDRTADLLVCWLIVYLWAMHTVFLGFGIGAIADATGVIPILTALLFLLFAPIVAKQPYRSMFGIRTKSCLADARHWTVVHRRFGIGMTVASSVALLSALLTRGVIAMFLLAVGPFVALIFAIGTGQNSDDASHDSAQ